VKKILFSDKSDPLVVLHLTHAHHRIRQFMRVLGTLTYPRCIDGMMFEQRPLKRRRDYIHLKHLFILRFLLPRSLIPGWSVLAISMPNYPLIKDTQMDIHVTMLYPWTVDARIRVFSGEWIFRQGYYHGHCMDTSPRNARLSFLLESNRGKYLHTVAWEKLGRWASMSFTSSTTRQYRFTRPIPRHYMRDAFTV